MKNGSNTLACVSGGIPHPLSETSSCQIIPPANNPAGFVSSRGHAPRGHTDHSISISYCLGGVRDQVHHNLPKLCGIGYGPPEDPGQDRFPSSRVSTPKPSANVSISSTILRKVNSFDNLALLPGIDHQLTDDFGAALRHLWIALSSSSGLDPASQFLSAPVPLEPPRHPEDR